MVDRTLLAATAGVLLTFASGAALAQAVAPGTGGAPMAGQRDGAATTGSSADGKSLSTKLNESGGVIKPKGNIDPGIHAPAPDPTPNSTPVIPPSATGGNSAK